ncbi:helix-turn-helix transcriptional regulator [Pseudonocardia acaciae]|uniref:helix-turn-helix transcriptional regulator n=1 Tax=Pseudonocardia acaciae TaxID=551276 RepID=UPI00048B4BCD|nr:helix-turn-helix transcriptional regulator [Pseudonocardia acaciae]
MVVNASDPDGIETLEEFGALLRELRGRLTQQAVARRSAIGPVALTRQRVSNIENGLLPTDEQLRCYLRGCGKPELFEDLDRVRRTLAADATTGEAADRGRSTAPRWRFAAIGASVVALVATSVAVTVVLNRGDNSGIPECAQGFICFWEEPDFRGLRHQLAPDWPSSSRCISLPFVAQSAMNSSNQGQKGYAEPGCPEPGTQLPPSGNTSRVVKISSYKHN